MLPLRRERSMSKQLVINHNCNRFINTPTVIIITVLYHRYQLQALVYLEAHKRGLQDHVAVAEQVI